MPRSTCISNALTSTCICIQNTQFALVEDVKYCTAYMTDLENDFGKIYICFSSAF